MSVTNRYACYNSMPIIRVRHCLSSKLKNAGPNPKTDILVRQSSGLSMSMRSLYLDLHTHMLQGHVRASGARCTSSTCPLALQVSSRRLASSGQQDPLDS